MNEHDKENANYSVDGYYVPNPFEDPYDIFDNAKKDLIKNYHRYIMIVESLSFEDFRKYKKRSGYSL